MPGTSTPNDIEQAFILAWKLGCKGLTIYRDQSKEGQVIEFGSLAKKNKVKFCPTCDFRLVREGKCYKCRRCGFSTCEF